MLRAKPLENWITLSEAAEILGVAPQAVHQMCESGKISEANLRRVGKASKPIFLVFRECVETLAETRRETAEAAQEALVAKDRSKALRRAARRPQLGYMAGEQ